MLHRNDPRSVDDPAIDLIVIGGGPAGLSAAITARKRNKKVVLMGMSVENSAIYPSHQIDNYPGMPGVSGPKLLKRMRQQAEALGVFFFDARVTSIMNYGRTFGVAFGTDYLVCRAIVLCVGVNRLGTIPGERELLGRGVSYCVTCDASLFEDEDVALLSFLPEEETEKERDLLEECCNTVTLFTRKGDYAILGQETVEGVSFNGKVTPCKGVFILRSSTVPETLLYALQVADGHILVDRDMQTSVRGAYAAGDCTGEPYQVAKAVGEGNVAALSACKYLESSVYADWNQNRKESQP